MRLFIAEKPSLAKAIYEGLGGTGSTAMGRGYLEIGDTKIAPCYGHMMELFDPEDYDEKYKVWSMDDLPIKAFMPPVLKAKHESKEQLDLIFKLIEEATDIVHAGDPDDEGQLLIDEILNHVGNTKPVYRVHIADLNLKPVQNALANLKPNSEFEHFGRSALARSIADQLFGYNLTRGFTLQGRNQGFDGVLNVGRVQSAVLGLINSRTLANLSHQESFYYEVNGQFSAAAGAISGKYQPSDNDILDEKNRIIEMASASQVITQSKGNTFTVSEAVTKPEKKAAPAPYNLSSLQQACAKKWGYSADRTLEIMQSLYETHKLLTYPRSDCRFLSDEHFELRDSILQAVTGTMPQFAPLIENANLDSKHKAFNSNKITAHHAICPTEKSGEGVTLTADEKNIYELIARGFIALFYPESVRDKTRVVLVNEHQREFVATQTDLLSQGWESLYGSEKEAPVRAVDLTAVQKGDTLSCIDASIDKKATTPPKYFVESTLLAAMSRAAKFISDPELRKVLEAKDKDNPAESGSIGTEATRASILKKLSDNSALISIEEEKGYKEKVWKTTKQGQDFCAALPNEIIAPDISAMWSSQQEAIKQGTLTVEAFVDGIDAYIEKQIEHIKTHGIKITPNMQPCPVCKQAYLRRRTSGTGEQFFACNRYPDCKTTYPDKGGKPDLTPRVKRIMNVSKHPCPVCSKGLIRRSSKFKGKTRYYWTCSGYPECKTTIFDQAGKPNYATAKTETTPPSDTPASE